MFSLANATSCASPLMARPTIGFASRTASLEASHTFVGLIGDLPIGLPSESPSVQGGSRVYPHTLHQPNGHQEYHQCAASVADEGKWQAGDRHYHNGHAYIHEDLKK